MLNFLDDCLQNYDFMSILNVLKKQRKGIGNKEEKLGAKRKAETGILYNRYILDIGDLGLPIKFRSTKLSDDISFARN